MNNDNRNFTITLPCKATFDDFTQDELNAIAKFLQLYIPADKTISEISVDPKECSEGLISVSYTTEDKGGINVPKIDIDKFIESIDNNICIKTDKLFVIYEYFDSDCNFSSIYTFGEDYRKLNESDIKNDSYISDQLSKMNNIALLSVKLLYDLPELNNILDEQYVEKVIICLAKGYPLSIVVPIKNGNILLDSKEYIINQTDSDEKIVPKMFQYPYGDLMSSLRYV